MRDIRFRAWNDKYKKMAYFDRAVINTFSPTTCLSFGLHDWEPVTKFCDDHYTHELDTNEPVLMQYTGLKDKNGKEIYEGDVVKICHEDYQDEPEEIAIGKVAYNLGGDYPAFEVYIKTNRGNLGWEAYHDEYNSFSCPEHVIEVIGNIYENPELLEES